MNRFLLTLLTMIFVSSVAFSQQIPLDPSVRTGTLANGLKYYIKQNKKPENKVELRLAIKAGAVQEDDSQRGLAHFMEHMNFNGTKSFPENQLVDVLQTLGIKFGQHLNAYTSFDETVYMLPVPLDKKGNLDVGFQVIEDWAFNATLTDKEIDKERGVILEEMRLGEGPDRRLMDRYLPKLLYKSKYAERLPIGTKEVVSGCDYEELRRFHREWYRPNLMAVAVVGDINVDEIEQKIKTSFGKYKNPVNARERGIVEVPNHQETFAIIEFEPEAKFSRAQLVYKDDKNYTPDETISDYEKSLVKQVFTTMLNNRIDEIVNSDNPPFTYAYTYHGNLVNSKEAFQSGAMTHEGKQLNALKVLMEETERASRYGFTEGELERAKTEMLSRLEKGFNERDKTESSSYVREMVGNFLDNEPMPGIEWELNKFKSYSPSISIEMVNKLAKTFVKDHNRLAIITGPKNDNIKQPTEKEVLSLFDEIKNAKLSPYEDKVAITSLISNLPAKGKITKTEKDDKIGTTTLTLSNGAKVTYKKTDFKDDEIMFEAVSLGGSSVLSDKDFIESQFVFGGLSEAGINNYTKSDLNKFLTGKRVSLSPSIGNLTESLSGKSNTKDFKTLMEMIYGYFTALNNNPASFEAYKSKQSAIYNGLVSDPQFYFSNEFNKFLQKNNPRFTNIVPLEEDWKRSDYQKGFDIFKKKFADADDFHFYFVGNIDENLLKEYAETYIATLPSTKDVENFKDHGYRSLKGTINKEIVKGKDPKSLVIMRYSGETKYNEKEALAMQALGEIATIKVIENLREEASGIYGGGAYGGMSKNPYGYYYFLLQFPCGPENAKSLTDIAIRELNKIVENGPEQKDLDKYKEGELNDLKVDIKTNDAWMQALTDYYVDGGDKYELLNRENNIKALTVKDIQNVAKKYLTKDRIIGTLMPEAGWEAYVKKEEAKTDVKVPTAQQIIDNYTKALGGKDKLSAVKTISCKTSMTMMGMEITGTEKKMAPNKMKITQSVMGQHMVTVFDGTKGYMVQGGNIMQLPEEAIAQMKESNLFDALYMKADDYKVEAVSVDNKDYYVLSSEKSKLYFDTKTNLLYKSADKDGNETIVDDYFTIDGIKLPAKFTTKANGQTLETIYSDYVLNQGVTEKDFE